MCRPHFGAKFGQLCHSALDCALKEQLFTLSFGHNALFISHWAQHGIAYHVSVLTTLYYLLS